MSVGELKTENALLQKRSLIHTLCFLLGFSIVFIAIGFGSSYIGNFFMNMLTSSVKLEPFLLLYLV